MAKAGSGGENGRGGAAKSASESAQRPNARPVRVTDLLYQGGVHPGWHAAARTKNRFYVLNLEYVLGELNIAHTNMKPYFVDAGTRISQQTKWREKYPIEFGCNFTHIFPDKREEPKQFGHAATIIFVLEEYARAHRQNFNVYDWLRIVPAQSFIDRFDRERYFALAEHYAKLPADERARTFGATAPATFEELCSEEASQPSQLIARDLAVGHCVTQYVAEKFCRLINSKFPAALHVGPVLCSGQQGYSKGLGKRNAPEGLRVVKERDTSVLARVPLAREPTELSFEVLKQNPSAVSDTVVGCDWRNG